MQNRAGSFITNLSGEMAYQSFRPAPLPPVPDIELNENLVAKLVDANRKIAVLEGLACRIPNMGLLFPCMSGKKHCYLHKSKERSVLWMISLTRSGMKTPIRMYPMS